MVEETLVHEEVGSSLPPPHSSRRNVEKLAEKKKKTHLQQQTCLSSGALGLGRGGPGGFHKAFPV